MRNHFKELKDAEVEALRCRHRAGAIPPKMISRLRKLVSKCRRDPEAGAAICYHDSLALIHEFDRNWHRAAEHRSTEMSFIEKLRAMMSKESVSLRRWALQSYTLMDLKERRGILKQLKQKGKVEASASANRWNARTRRIQSRRKGRRSVNGIAKIL